jgi:hypothetical protein
MEGWKTEGISNSKVPRYKTGNSEVMSALGSGRLIYSSLQICHSKSLLRPYLFLHITFPPHRFNLPYISSSLAKSATIFYLTSTYCVPSIPCTHLAARSQSQAMAVDHDLSSFVFNHIFYPPELPQEAENNLTELENRLTVLVRDVLQDFVQSLGPGSQQRWGIVLSMLDTWIKVHTDQGIVQIALEKGVSNLKYTGKSVIFRTVPTAR